MIQLLYCLLTKCKIFPLPNIPVLFPLPNIPVLFPLLNIPVLFPLPNIPVLFPLPNIPILFPLRNIPVQEILYMRQLWGFTFCIHNIKSDRAKFYIYHERQGRKSPEKVFTFLLDYMTNELPQTVNLILFSDSCGGQNKNHTLTRFLRNLSDNKVFGNITQYFSIRGHSFLACDRGFGNIKRLIGRFDRIYTPKQYAELITRVSKLNKFSAKMIDATYILSFKSWWPKKYKKKTETLMKPLEEASQKIKELPSKYRNFSSLITKPPMWRKYKQGSGEMVLTINNFSMADFTNISHALPTEKAYLSDKVPINSKKIADLKKLEKYVIRYCYGNIFKWPTKYVDFFFRQFNTDC